MHSLARGDFIVKYSKGEHSTGYRITPFSRLDLTHPFVPSLTHCLTSVLTHPLASYLSSLFPTLHTPPLCTSHCSLRVGSLLLMLIPAAHNHKFDLMRHTPLPKPSLPSCLPRQTSKLLPHSFHSMRIEECPSPCLHC